MDELDNLHTFICTVCRIQIVQLSCKTDGICIRFLEFSYVLKTINVKDQTSTYFTSFRFRLCHRRIFSVYSISLPQLTDRVYFDCFFVFFNVLSSYCIPKAWCRGSIIKSREYPAVDFLSYVYRRFKRPPAMLLVLHNVPKRNVHCIWRGQIESWALYIVFGEDK